MKTTVLLILAFSLFTNFSIAQERVIKEYFNITPGDIKSQNSEVEEYDVTLKWQNLDAISGQKFNCNAVKATYIVGLENDYVQWQDVSLAQIDDFNQTVFKGTELPSFDGFTYKAIDTAFLSEGFYKSIPLELQDLAKWLVSDGLQMHGLAIYMFDSLEYNKEFFPGLLENYDVKFDDWVTFTSRYQRMIWSGIGMHNDKICAIVKFDSNYNPVKIDNERMRVDGRSLYYGEMWISLTDKQLEYASMFEDVIMKLTSTMFPEEQLIDLQREIVFNKRK